MKKKKIKKIPMQEGEVKCTLPLKEITRKEIMELEKLRYEYSEYDDSELYYTKQSPIIDFLVEEQIDGI